jgi:hypothetical protein
MEASRFEEKLELNPIERRVSAFLLLHRAILKKINRWRSEVGIIHRKYLKKIGLDTTRSMSYHCPSSAGAHIA